MTHRRPADRDLELAHSLVKESFHEVLDATKHQDDKIGRILTAIAFLTTAAVALLFSTEAVGRRFPFKHSQYFPFPLGQDAYPLIAFASYVFFTCIVASVVLLLISLTTPLRLPGRPTLARPSLGGSRLFFTHIGKEPADEWEERWKHRRVRQVQREMYIHYVRETHNLAERAITKYNHTGEAVALFIYSLLYFIIGLILSLQAGSQLAGEQYAHQPMPSHPLPWSSSTALPIAFVIAGHAIIQLYGRWAESTASQQLIREYALGNPEAETDYSTSVKLIWMMALFSVYIFAVLWPGEAPGWRRFGFVVATVAVIAAATLTRPRDKDGSSLLRHWLWAAVPIGAALLSLGVGGALQLVAALLPSSWLMGRTLLERPKRHLRDVRKRRAKPSAERPHRAGEASLVGHGT